MDVESYRYLMRDAESRDYLSLILYSLWISWLVEKVRKRLSHSVNF